MIKEIASTLSVSESTIYRRMQSYGLSSLDFSDISDKDLDHHITELSKDFPFCGEGIVLFSKLLLSKEHPRWPFCTTTHALLTDMKARHNSV